MWLCLASYNHHSCCLADLLHSNWNFLRGGNLSPEECVKPRVSSGDENAPELSFCSGTVDQPCSHESGDRFGSLNVTGYEVVRLKTYLISCPPVIWSGHFVACYVLRSNKHPRIVYHRGGVWGERRHANDLCGVDSAVCVFYRRHMI